MSSKGGLQHQDWTPVVLRKNTKPQTKEEKIKAGIVTVSTNNTNKQSTSDINKKKLEEDEEYKPPTVSYNLAQQIQQARVKKNLTQKQLAQQCNLPISTIQTYENSHANTAVESSVLQKLSKALGVTLKKNS